MAQPPRSLPPLLEQLTANPLLIDDRHGDLFEASVLHVLGHEHAADFTNRPTLAANGDSDFWPQPDSWEAAYRPYNVVDGILQIPVMGVLLNRFPYQLGRWATGYKYLEMARKRGMADENVKGIAYIHHSPGGEVAGCFEEVDAIYESRGTKPIRAFVADYSYSASFALASAADDIIITRSGGIGSVGVVTAHVDFSEAYAQMGIKITHIFAGKHKVDGNSTQPLPKEVKARIEKRIEKLYAVFTETVARNRAMEDSAVRATEALTYDAEDGMEVGFADRLGALEDEMANFAVEADIGDEQMADTKTYTQEQYDAAVAAARTEGETAGKTAGIAEGKTAGATEAATRLSAILDSEEGKKRPKAALNAATKTKMTAEEAVAFLATLDEEKATAPEGGKPKGKTELTPFEQAMGNNNPNVGAEAGGEGGEGGEGEEDTSASILSAFGAVTGIKKPTKAA